MHSDRNHRVCPVERAGALDINLRKLFHNPRGILRPFVKTGMTALDLGCGPGYFTIEMSRLAGNSGKVIAADLQDGMLGIVKQKIKKYGISNIELYKCGEDRIGLQEKADFILIFWMLHEVPDQQAFLREIKTLLNPGGKVLIAEPGFHVSKKDFQRSIDIINKTGFETSRGPGIFFSKTILLKNNI